jgi:hypothetical protein
VGAPTGTLATVPSAALAENEEQSTELGTLRRGEPGEDLVFGVALRLSGAFELLFAASRDGDDVPAAVVRGAFA